MKTQQPLHTVPILVWFYLSVKNLLVKFLFSQLSCTFTLLTIQSLLFLLTYIFVSMNLFFYDHFSLLTNFNYLTNCISMIAAHFCSPNYVPDKKWCLASSNCWLLLPLAVDSKHQRVRRRNTIKKQGSEKQGGRTDGGKLLVNSRSMMWARQRGGQERRGGKRTGNVEISSGCEVCVRSWQALALSRSVCVSHRRNRRSALVWDSGDT